MDEKRAKWQRLSMLPSQLTEPRQATEREMRGELQSHIRDVCEEGCEEERKDMPGGKLAEEA